jgi:hypothetical protein
MIQAMKSNIRLSLTLAAAVAAGHASVTAQELNTQILLPDPLVSTTSLSPWSYGKALLSDPLPSSDPRPGYQSLFLGTLADPALTSTIWRIDPDPDATPAFSEFTITPLDARIRFITKLAYNEEEKVLYAAGDVVVQNTKPRSTSTAWLVRRTAYAQSGAANAWSDSEPPFVLAKGAESRAQGIAIDPAGNMYVSGRASDAKGHSHTIIRRKAPGAASTWEKVYDKLNTSSGNIETKISYFPGSPTAPAAYLMVGNENRQWTILRSTTGKLGSWSAVDSSWSAANAPAGAKDIAYDPQSGRLYAVGYRGTFGAAANGWVVRASSDGGQTWTGLLDEACPSYSWADDLAIDAAGGVVVIGHIGVLNPNATWVPQMHLVRCTDPTDAMSWQTGFAGVPLPFDEANCYSSLGQAVAADASGAIFATGVLSDWADSRTSPATQYSGNHVGLLRLVP